MGIRCDPWLGEKEEYMKHQTFNLRNRSGFLGTIRILAKTPPDATADRLRRYVARRMKEDVTVHPVLNA